MDTSTASRLSAAWVGTASVSGVPTVKVSMSTSFGVNDSYFVTTVTLQSLVSTPLYNVSWMRNVDPDQEQVRRKLQAHTEMVPCSRLPVLTHWRLLLPAVLPSLRHTPQPWSGFFDTSNYVKYQRYRPGEPNRANTAVPNMCLVVATGTVYTNLTLGLGTVHPNCRVSHYGFVNNDATEGWLNSNWTAFDETNPLSADEAINLNYLFPVLDAGASVSFTWAYILNLDDSATVTGAVSSVTFTLSNSTKVGVVVDGSTCSSMLVEADVSQEIVLVVTLNVELCRLFVCRMVCVLWRLQSTVVGVAYDPFAPDITTGGGLYQIFVDVSQFPTADGCVSSSHVEPHDMWWLPCHVSLLTPHPRRHR